MSPRINGFLRKGIITEKMILVQGVTTESNIQFHLTNNFPKTILSSVLTSIYTI